MEEQIIESGAAITPEVPSGEVASGQLPEGKVDTPPDPAALRAEVERLEAVRKKAEEDARYWRQEKARARGDFFKGRQQDPEKLPDIPVQDVAIGKEPQKDDFDDYEKYLDAKISFETSKARIQWDREQARKSQETEHQQKITKLQEKINLGFVEYPDFEEVAMNEMVPITPAVMEALAECDNPHKVAYYLGKNRAEAIQISRMTPMQTARALARIEVEIEKAGPSNAPNQSNRITNAPPPIRPSGSSNVVGKDPEKMTQREYEDWRKTQGARRF